MSILGAFAARLLGATCLSTPIMRRALATLLVMGPSWLAWPARAENFNVANDSQLRGAISSAGNGDTITFTANIALSSNLPVVTRSVGFNGGNFTLSGDNQYRGLFVQSGTVGINDLTITNAIAQGGQGAGGWHAAGGGGGAGLGGALFVATGANVTVQNVTLQNSTARGGNGGQGDGAFGASGGGGGYWPFGANAGFSNNSEGGAGGGGTGDGFGSSINGGFGGGAGGGTSGGSGGFGGGGGGSWSKSAPSAPGGFLGGAGGRAFGNGGGGGGGGAGLGGAIFVQDGGNLTLASSLGVSGNTVAGGRGGKGDDPRGSGDGQPGGGAGTGIFLNGNGTLTLAPGAAALSQTISDAIVDQTGVSGSWANAGSWSLVKDGPGTTILTGANAYTGGTTVKSGVLQGTTRSLQGNILNNAIVILDQDFDATFAGDIAGTGTLIKRGHSTTVLSGTYTYTGGIIVSAGALWGTADSLRGNILNNANVVFEQASDGTYAGDMTGSGSLLKGGTGKLTLTGANRYSGGTFISNGSLQGTATSLQGAISNDAAVIFDQAFDGTYAGNMTGNGTLTKVGTGKVVLTGISQVGGGTTINAGGLSVNGHLTSNVILNKDGTLSGVGHIVGHITNNGGTIKPGNSIGHLTVNGNFAFNGGTYEVEANARGESDRVSVIGAGHKVMINAGTLRIVPESGTYVPNTTYTIITTEGGGTVTFDTVTGGVGFLTPKISLDREHIYVTLALAPNAFRSAGQSVNQQAVGGALDALASAGSTGGLLTAMANLPTSQGSAALQAMSGQPWADFGTVNLQASMLFMNAVGRQMAVERGAGLGGTRSVALTAACEVTCDVGTAPRFSAWLSGIGSTGNVAGDGNATGLTYTLGGAAFGIDYRPDPRFLLGIAGGYLGGMQGVNGFAGNGYSDALSVALYGSFMPNGPAGGFYADALVGYANASNRLQRSVAIPGLPTGIASGNTNANQFLGQIETGYRFALGFPGNMSISPFGRVQIGSITQAAFTESGSSFFNLSVAQQTTTSVRTTFGADFAARFDLASGMPLDLGLRLGWVREFANTARPMTAAFAAAPGPQFTVWGATPQRDSAVVGFSAATALNERTSLFFSYDGEVGGGTDNHRLRAGLRLTW